MRVIAQLSPAEITPKFRRWRPPWPPWLITCRSSPARRPLRRCYAPADQGVAEGLEAVLSDNTRRVYAAQWRVFTDWCGDVDLRALPAGPLTAARYLAVCAGSGATIATLGLAAFAIVKFHQWAGHDSLAKIAV